MEMLGIVLTIAAALGLIAWRRLRGRRSPEQLARAAEALDPAPKKPKKGKKPRKGSRKQPEPSPEEAAEAEARAKERVERLKRHGFAVDEEAPPPPADGLPLAPVGWTRPNPRIAEGVSAVLRRQVPVRFDEPVRSWLGGLPSLPDDIEWPRGTNADRRGSEPRPLHFVAQIACADLPKDLWAGLGPREGWLLFFINPNTGNVDEREHFRVLYTREPGSERQPPADIEVLADGTYADYTFNHWFDRAAMPRQWLRWPVDLVEVPNERREEEGRALAAPADLAQRLYPGQPVAPDNLRMAQIDPFSWRCLSQAWADLSHWLDAPLGEVSPAMRQMTDALLAQEDLGGLTAGLDQEIARWSGQPSPDEPGIAADERERRLRVAKHLAARQREREELALLLAEAADAETLAAFLEEQRRHQALWRERAMAELAPFDRHMATVDPDSALSAEDWQELKAFLKAHRLDEWHLAHGPENRLVLEKRRLTLWDRFKPRVAAMTQEVAAACYVDPARRQLLPDHAAQALEPFWRRLEEGRPHRLGGYHDGLQSDAAEGPTDTPLLLQLASDDAMQWCWGDGGAIYAWIETGALSRGEFWATTAHLECH